MSYISLVVRLCAVVMTLVVLIGFDIYFVPVSESDVFVPKHSRELLERFKRTKQRAKDQRVAAAAQFMEIENAVFQIETTLEGIKLDPNSHEIKAKLERLRAKVGSTSAADLSPPMEEEEEEEEEEEDVLEDLNDDDDEEVAAGMKRTPAAVKKVKKKLVKSKSSSSSSSSSSLDNPRRNPEVWAKVKDGETSAAMAQQMESWIVQGKTKRLGFDLGFDWEGDLTDGNNNNNNGETTLVPVIRSEPGEAQRRFISRTKPSVPPEMQAFVSSQLRIRTYSHMTKNVDTERHLKQLGYKQKAGSSNVVSAGGRDALFQGYFGESCPHFVENERVITFCNYFLPTYREQEQQVLLKQMDVFHPNLLGGTENFFPPTWLLYKQLDRRLLRTRTQNDSLTQEGGPYVNKFSFSHGAGKPSLTAKMFSQLRKSDESSRLQTQEAKQKMIAQWYCNTPYLFEGKKFIIRTWAVIISVFPKLIVLYHDGAILRSVSPYSPFVKRDAHYKRETHFTNDQSKHKGTLRSSSLYASLGQFQHWLNANNKETKTFVKDSLRPRIKARMIYALYAMLRPPVKTTEGNSAEDEPMGYSPQQEEAEEGEIVRIKKSPKLPKEVSVVQPVCFDFLLQEGGEKLWFLGAHTTAACMVNLGGDSFKPPWKVNLQTALADKLVELGEEMLWRQVANKTLDNLVDLITDMPLDVLIDETLPGWDYKQEISWYLSGGHVDGGLGGRDVVEAIDLSHDSKAEDEGGNNSNGGGGGAEDELEEEDDDS